MLFHSTLMQPPAECREQQEAPGPGWGEGGCLICQLTINTAKGYCFLRSRSYVPPFQEVIPKFPWPLPLAGAHCSFSIPPSLLLLAPGKGTPDGGWREVSLSPSSYRSMLCPDSQGTSPSPSTMPRATGGAELSGIWQQ